MKWETRMFCSCGKEVFDKRLLGSYKLTQKDSKGKIIFAKCFHDVIVRDERKKIVTLEKVNGNEKS